MEIESLPNDKLREYYRLFKTANDEGGNRVKIIRKYGWDVKFGYHVVRLLNEVEQIMTEGDLDLERSREQLKAIRAGEVSFDKVKDYFTAKEKGLEALYNETKVIPYSCDEAAIKNVLLQCLEQTYGDLDKCIERVGQDSTELVREIKELIKRKGF